MITIEPLRSADRRPDVSSPARRAGNGGEVSARMRMTILLVDDVRETTDMYALYFKHVGAHVITAIDGQSALTAAKSERPDVIVLDLAMPGMTGWEVMAELRKDPRTQTVPILVVSGQREKERALRSGADAYLEKPSLPDHVFGELLTLLGRA